MVRLCQSALRLRLDLAALATAHKAFELFPQSTRSLGALAVVSRSLDGPETALFMLGRPRLFPDPALDVLEADLLYSTQRYSETESFCDARMLPKPRTGPDLPQSASVIPTARSMARARRTRTSLPRRGSSRATAPKRHPRSSGVSSTCG